MAADDLLRREQHDGVLRSAMDAGDLEALRAAIASSDHASPDELADARRRMKNRAKKAKQKRRTQADTAQADEASAPAAPAAQATQAQAEAEATTSGLPPSDPPPPDASQTVPLSLASLSLTSGQRDVDESTMGGGTTCSVCFVGAKTHLAAPCGHQCACEDCARLLANCPICRAKVSQWIKVHIA
mmetsp:Transcript_37816/g.100467  ORF Transcript_37816/g.100467 Transcript_37816/m.100467 type:complete len:186 (+) Transcript_37816:877-1434(+)